jgi:hypothetical protein
MERINLQKYISYILSFINENNIYDFLIIRKLEMLNNVIMNCHDDFFPTLIRNIESIAEEIDIKLQNERLIIWHGNISVRQLSVHLLRLKIR